MVDFTTVWPTLKFVVECLTMLISYVFQVSSDFVSSFWCWCY